MPRTGRFVTPAPLREGDAVGLVAPASWAEDAWLDETVAILGSWGLDVVRGAHLRDRHGYLAGRDADRLSDLNTAIRDPRIRAVLSLVGGCGSFRLVPGVDQDALRRDPKPLIGFSDITALHRVWHRAGVAALHGALGGSHRDEVRAELFGQQPEPYASDPTELTAALTTTGTAEGILFGGNLEMLARSIGVLPFDLTDHVLLLEIHRAAGLGMVDRALTQLVLSGALDSIRGVALGRATGFDDHTDRGWTLLDVLREHLDRLHVPVLGGLPIGHGPDARTIPVGVPCRLDAGTATLTAQPALG